MLSLDSNSIFALLFLSFSIFGVTVNVSISILKFACDFYAISYGYIKPTIVAICSGLLRLLRLVGIKLLL